MTDQLSACNPVRVVAFPSDSKSPRFQIGDSPCIREMIKAVLEVRDHGIYALNRLPLSGILNRTVNTWRTFKHAKYTACIENIAPGTLLKLECESDYDKVKTLIS
jgi:hypothetical protein